MRYIQRQLHDLPAHRGLLQDLACTPLSQRELTAKYGFVFEGSTDELSATEVTFIETGSGRLFAVVCRSDVAEWSNTIRTELSEEPLATFVPRMLAEFCASTDFAVADLDHIWAEGA